MYLIVFVALPLYAPSLVPPELEGTLADSGFDLAAFIQQISMIGVVVAVVTLVKGFVEPSSPLHLAASLASSLVMLVFTLITLSLGDIGDLGFTTVNMTIEGGVNTVVLDMRFFVQIATLTVGLQVINSILEFIDARKGPVEIEASGQSV
jgi:hypothetical protein